MDRVRIYEVSPRDGLQNEAVTLSADTKVALVERLVAAGVTDVEVTSFVSPRAIPQLGDAAEVIARLPAVDGVRYWGLVPNPVGLERALECGLGHVATFMSASETHNLKNVNRTVRESLAGLERVIGSAVAQGLRVRSYVSTAWGCPYEGEVSPMKVIQLAIALREAGAHEIALGDTTGMGSPDSVERLIEALVGAGLPLDGIACHFHDTRGTAVANALAAWRAGVRTFDGSVGGIGGCPYAPGAAGNAATEDLVHLFERLGGGGVDLPAGPLPITGVDLDRLCEITPFMERALGRTLPGRYAAYHQGQLARRAARVARSG